MVNMCNIHDNGEEKRGRTTTTTTTATTTTTTTTTTTEKEKGVVLVDPYSTGCCLAQEIMKRGYYIVVVWSKEISTDMKQHVPTNCGEMLYKAEIMEQSTITETAVEVHKIFKAHQLQLLACMCAGESGVNLADALSERLHLRTNGSTIIPNRRDKKLQQELIRAYGLRAVRQAGGQTFSQLEPFLKNEKSYPVVLKPVESAGSDGVKLCHTYEEAKEHFYSLVKSVQKVGRVDGDVICQEFLRGKEYVVDHVSRDGIHKTMMVFAYDKRPVNGAEFVYFGLQPVDSNSLEAKILISYVRGVLDAMLIKNGATHGEVIMTSNGPCLVEMNCRAHGGDGNWIPLARALTGGYCQVDAYVDAYLDGNKFQNLPDVYPSPFKASGQEVMLVSFSTGVVNATPGFDVIKCLPSFVSLETHVDKGVKVDYTIDLFTNTGSVILMHTNEEIMKKDLEFIRYMEEINSFFVYETKQENLKRPRGDNIALSPISETKVKNSSSSSSTCTTTTTIGHHHRRVYSSDGPFLIRHFSNDRPELRGMTLMKRMTTIDASNEAVIVVDPYSTGACLSKDIAKRGYNVIALWSKDLPDVMKNHIPISCTDFRYHDEVREQITIDETVSAVRNAAKSYRIVACICGGEVGVQLTDCISEKLRLRTNGTDINGRRDKKVQQELIKAAGLRSTRQEGGKSFHRNVEKFLMNEDYPLVVKPVESAGSDGVKLCHNFNEAKEHYQLLLNSQRKVGRSDAPVICQEFLKGKEYVIDHASRDGVHKTTMIWVYDKRPVNGSAFVYFGLKPIDSKSNEAKILVPYVRKVLDALGLKNGASHGEVIMTSDGPCLVEMNCRVHGGDGNWIPLVQALTGGYSQVDVCVDSYLDKKQFSILPDIYPSPFKAAGEEVMLVSYSTGVVTSTPGFDAIKKLQSFVFLETGIKVGSKVDYTVDLYTTIGSVILMHHNKSILENDLNYIRQMERDNAFFEYKTRREILRAPSSVFRNKPNRQHRRLFSSDRQEVAW